MKNKSLNQNEFIIIKKEDVKNFLGQDELDRMLLYIDIMNSRKRLDYHKKCTGRYYKKEYILYKKQ